MPVGEPFALEAGGIDGGAFAHAGDDILQNAAFRRVMEHIAGSHCRHMRGGRHIGQGGQPRRIAGAAAQGQRKIAARAEQRA